MLSLEIADGISAIEVEDVLLLRKEKAVEAVDVGGGVVVDDAEVVVVVVDVAVVVAVVAVVVAVARFPLMLLELFI